MKTVEAQSYLELITQVKCPKDTHSTNGLSAIWEILRWLKMTTKIIHY